MNGHSVIMFLKNRYKVGIKASPAQAVASLKIFWNAPLEVLFLTNWYENWEDLVFCKTKKGGCVLGGEKWGACIRSGAEGINGRVEVVWMQ
jgi:hypothetical protein